MSSCLYGVRTEMVRRKNQAELSKQIRSTFSLEMSPNLVRQLSYNTRFSLTFCLLLLFLLSFTAYFFLLFCAPRFLCFYFFRLLCRFCSFLLILNCFHLPHVYNIYYLYLFLRIFNMFLPSCCT